MISQEEISAFFDLIFSWFIQTLPKLLLLIIVFIVIRWLSKKFIDRFKTTILNRVDGKGDQKEKEKRVTTLVGILKGVISVTLWVVFIMIFLKERGSLAWPWDLGLRSWYVMPYPGFFFCWRTG